MTESMITIAGGREKSIHRQHPWIFSGAIDRIEGDPAPGAIVTVVSKSGSFLARGYWNAKSQIQVRLLTWHDEPIDAPWWRRIIARAVDARKHDLEAHRGGERHEGYRLINAENDYLPGLLVDCYGGWLVLQALTLHIDQHKKALAQMVVDTLSERGITIRGVYERSDVDVRRKEGLREQVGLLWGDAPPELIELGGDRVRHFVDVRRGHKTGAYLDQKRNHQSLANVMGGLDDEDNAALLNLFSYTGRFGLGTRARVVNVDASRDALELGEKNYTASGVPEDRADFIQADVFEFLRDQAEARATYDVAILDPPKFAHNKQQIDRAARGYKDINLNTLRLIRPGGYLMTFSCSGAISRDLFQKIVFGALEDSRRQAQIVAHLSAGDDHPVALTFPEGEYLKGLLLRVY